MRFILLLPFLLGWLLCSAQSNFPIAPFAPQSQQEALVPSGSLPSAEPSPSKPGLRQFAEGLLLKAEVSNLRPLPTELVQVRWVLYYPNMPGLKADYQIVDYTLPNLPHFVKEWNIIVSDSDSVAVKSVRLNGRSYRARTLLCFYMCPVDCGKFTLSQGSLSVQLYKAGGGKYGQPVRLVSAQQVLEVRAKGACADGLPSGAIGDFSLSAGLLNTDSIFVGQPFVYRVTVSGSGNFKFINPPSFSFPSQFEVHRLEPVRKVGFNCQGSAGSAVFDYLLTPSVAGSFSIPQPAFGFFNPQTQKYHSLEGCVTSVNVHPSPVVTDNAVVAEHTQPSATEGEVVAHSASSSLLWFLGTVVVFLVALVFWKRHGASAGEEETVSIEEETYAAMMAANGSLQGEQFYKQVIRLLMNYISVKLNYKVATQSKAVLASILLENGISRHTADKAIALIDYCEQVCYAQKRDFSNREYINDLFCEVVCELHNDFSRSVKCSRLK